MKKFKKIAIFVVAAVMTLGAGVGINAANDNGGENLESNEDHRYYDGYIMNTAFMNVSGTVTEVVEGEDGRINFRIEYGEESAAYVVANSFHTFILGDKPEVGHEIKAYFPSNAPMTMIWPPRYNARVIINMTTEDITNVRVDRFFIDEDFGGNLVSSDGSLMLYFTDDTPIIREDGADFRYEIKYWDGELMDELNSRLMLVLYGPTTRMIPAQTIPGEDGQGLTIYVLFETAVHLPGDVGGLDLGLGLFDGANVSAEWTNYGIVVNNEQITETWQAIEGGYYVPFRAVVNALGFGDSIGWNPDNASITVEGEDGRNINFVIGSSDVTVNGEVVAMQGAARLVDGVTYVPFQFFRSYIFGMNNAFHFEGQVVIDNQEAMH